MRILIETQSRWRFAVTSPSHAVVERTGRPGAQSFASLTSKPTSATEDRNSKPCRRSLDAYDIVEEAWPEPTNLRRPSRCRSFRKRFCRFLVHFSRMPCVDNTYGYYDVGEALPPYPHDPLPELPADCTEGSSSIQELPDPSLMTPEILGQDVFELEGHFPNGFNLQDVLIDTAGMPSVPSQAQASNKWSQPLLGYTTQRAFASVATPAYLPSLTTEQQVSALPEMTSGEQSHDSSPVSPFTPRPETSPGMQHNPGSAFSTGMMSPHESIFPATSQYAAEGQLGYEWPSTLDTPIRVSPTESSATSTPTSGSGFFYGHRPIPIPSPSLPFTHGLMQYQHSTPGSFTTQHALPNHIPWPNSEEFPLGTLERGSDSRWFRRPGDESNLMEGDGTNHLSEINGEGMVFQNGNNSISRRQNASIQSEHGLDEQPQGQSQSDTYEVGDFPPEVCDKCGTQFNGRYRKGNLKRHVRERHSLLKSMIGKSCRVCKHLFNRRDATRKHEWKKHRLLDAKPNKRRKS